MPQKATVGPRGKITTWYKLSQNINSPSAKDIDVIPLVVILDETRFWQNLTALRTAVFWVITHRAEVTWLRKYHYSLLNKPEEGSYQIFGSGNLKSRILERSLCTDYTVYTTSWKVRGSNPRKAKRCCFLPIRSDKLSGPHSPLFNGYRCSSLGKVGVAWSSHPVPKLRMSGAIPLLPLYAFVTKRKICLFNFFPLQLEILSTIN